MPPKKFKPLDMFAEEKAPDGKLGSSPFGGNYSRNDHGQNRWNQNTPYTPQGYGYNYYQGGYQSYENYQGYQNYQQNHSMTNNSGNSRQKQYGGNGQATKPSVSQTGFNSSSVTSLNTLISSMSDLAVSPLTPHIEALVASNSIADAKKHVLAIIEEFTKDGVSGKKIEEWDILSIINKLVKPKNAPLIREAAMLLISKLAAVFTDKGIEMCYLLGLLAPALDSISEKDTTVKMEAQRAVAAIYSSFPTEALTCALLPVVLEYLSSGGRWQSKIAALKLVDNIREDSPADALELCFKTTLPVLTDVATDFKPELAKQGSTTLLDFISILDNLDLQPSFKLIATTLQNPKLVPECIKSLSSVTFVTEVTESSLSLLVPILNKSLNLSSSSQEQLRQTVIVIENLTRLVNNRIEIASFIPQLLPGVKRLYETATMPEVRELSAKALEVLEEDDSQRDSFPGRITLEQSEDFLKKGMAKLKNNPYADEKEYATAIDYLSKVLQMTANVNDWNCLNNVLVSAFGEENKDVIEKEFITELRLMFHQDIQSGNMDDGIEIVNADFSLAYGSRMLLNKTTLRLLKGHRYGLCGRNGAGKSTLMRSIANGQLEGFPPQDEIKTCFVERTLQGEQGDLDVVSFIKGDETLQGASQEEVISALESVGFDESKRSQSVGSLSGGWKMKLELTKAMLQKADVLMLDEPTNHLDVKNVEWLQNYLLEHTDITSLIVSHDTKFLDNVCTDIIHYENKKLAYYKGNLADFVNQKPEAKSYYTFTDSNAQMHFPPPGILSGVKSNTRAVAKMTNVSFTYPGDDKPSLKDVSCFLSLSSRVAIIGANGAGKSTLIKLMTGEYVPTSGKVEKHPNLRIGYIAQHALQHVNEHKEKTANQYLQWRYRFGDDREVLLKESRKISSEEERLMMEKQIDIGDGRGMRAIEAIVGRQKLKKSFQYEIKWKWWKPKYNSWVPKEVLLENGFEKLVQKFDDHEASREGLGYRELIPSVITKHFEGIGLDSDIANHTPLGSLSGGQLVKVVIAGAMWNNPHLLVLDEPTNYLDRDSLGALAMAIREWTGGVVMISHNTDFVGALCPEQWFVENGMVVHKGIKQVDQSQFEDGGNEEAVGLKVSAKAGEDDDSPANIKVRIRKKRMTRNEKKAQAERRRLRYIEWLSSPKGTPKPADTDDEEEEE
ncbi:HER121Cp [Eremothecium sinecaudum]|uniref:HER121Cp n=1 Tax=Eremothecium sinecaudum TaxID=45286 RepID=A0A0X8HTW8_9SACH|nr:HER121Cp [Eremothecium sinecaudum]AMD21400.1 HER121Cp [Eremothecium sinecaudum]